MKIYKTKNLNSSVQLNQLSTNNVSSKEFRLKNYSEQMLMPKLSAESAGSMSISFGKKKPNLKDAKKFIATTKKLVGDIPKEPRPEVKRGDKLIENPLFNWILSKYEFEPVIQAGASALICMALRPATIMALPSKKNKEDNIYASSHSFASGIMGLVSAILLTAPFKSGGDYVTRVMRKNFKPEVLERLYPQLDINSIWLDKAKGIRREIFSKYENGKKVVQGWKNKDGKDFVDNIKDIQFMPAFRQLADVSELTYSKILKINVDWAAQKGKSFNDIVLKDGSKLYDKIDMSKLGIIVKENGHSDAQILLQDLDKGYLSKLINDSKGIKDSNWGNLDINSVYDEKGLVKDFRLWKEIGGKQWHFDLDKAYVASPIEEISRRPRISGRKRFDKKDNEYKFITYQNNGVDGMLGTAVDETLAEAAVKNEAQLRLLTWGPDIATRIPVAATTIALIPWTLKHVFGIEKSKKPKDNNTEVVSSENKQDNKKTETTKTENVNFKGKKNDPEKVNWFIKQFGKWYGKPIIESKRIADWSAKLNNLPGKLTQHMMVLGSLITSSVYMTRTLQSKELKTERKRTLAINQLLCFIVPTAGAYMVDNMLKDRMEKFEYRVSNKMQYARDLAKMEGKEIPKFARNPKNAKGVRVLTSIGIFALIYRYLTPVAMTPVANWFGDKLNSWFGRNKKVQNAKEVELYPQSDKKAESASDKKESKQAA